MSLSVLFGTSFVNNSILTVDFYTDGIFLFESIKTNRNIADWEHVVCKPKKQHISDIQ